jgi:hypothetical protein
MGILLKSLTLTTNKSSRVNRTKLTQIYIDQFCNLNHVQELFLLRESKQHNNVWNYDRP